MAIADEFSDREGDYVIRQEHIDRTSYKEETPVCLIVRDPRDVAVSAWKYWNRPSLLDTINIMGKGLWPMPHGGGWSSFYSFWVDKIDVGGFMFSYEELLDDTVGELRWMLHYFDIKPKNSINEAVKRQSFDARKEIAKQHGDMMPYGREVQLKLLRRGIAGDWANYFGEEEKKLAADYFGEVAEVFGYNLY
jgi:hypothetical protein